MRIGFLFNHDQIHQVAHLLPIAQELARISDAEIILATTTDRIHAEVLRLGGGGDIVPLKIKTPTSRLLRRIGGKLFPLTKLLVYRDNLEFFKSLDVLVVAEKTSLVLRNRYGLTNLKIIHTRHGAGDRAIGFNRASADFDHVLVPGAKIRDRLVMEAGVKPESISIVGYPKFDLFAESRASHPFVDSGRKVVLYNPHVSPHLSSWFTMGRQVLEWFAAHDEYQLIFAPHVMLFERKFALSIDRLRVARPGRIDDRFLSAANIHVDIGSRASTTMEYVNRADIYLGDVSSQVYEFLSRPRPCVFLNAHKFQWQDDPNFLSWHCGPVIDDVAQLQSALSTAQAEQATRYEPLQRDLLAYTFDIQPGRPSSGRAARAVATAAGLPCVDWPEEVQAVSSKLRRIASAARAAAPL